VEGGSSLHDWSMTSRTGVGEGSFLIVAGKLKTIRTLTVSFVAETLKSGTKGLDTNAYKALNTGKNKEIRFDLTEFTIQGSSCLAKGDLTIAGVTRAVSFPVKLTASGNKLSFEGSFETKLTTFSVTPPTALLGTVKTHDAIKISFNSTFQPVF
jgi:polyisoprenoid-binding protein YceI